MGGNPTWKAVRMYCVRIMGCSCLASTCAWISSNRTANLAISAWLLPCRHPAAGQVLPNKPRSQTLSHPFGLPCLLLHTLHWSIDTPMRTMQNLSHALQCARTPDAQELSAAAAHPTLQNGASLQPATPLLPSNPQTGNCPRASAGPGYRPATSAL